MSDEAKAGSDVEALCAAWEVAAASIRGKYDACGIGDLLVAALRASQHAPISAAALRAQHDGYLPVGNDCAIVVASEWEALKARPVVPPEVREAFAAMERGDVGSPVAIRAAYEWVRSLLAPAREPEERP